MANLRQLFDLQKIADDKELAAVIEETNGRYASASKLSDDELELAAAGGSAQYMKIACNVCGCINKVNIMKDSYTCIECKTKHRISG